ncbi:actin-binding ADF family protein [Nocardia crassostreae]|uniref:actin-binding ADF family protein n=1 Tax=Nocardia crassostreae TaxID=53428 RepID=UPI000A078CE4|nr:actin depolymerization factor/cofilin-like domain-containing protein [Nocardia crassostreae]
MSSGVAVSDACLEAFNKLKLEQAYRYIIFNVNVPNKEIVVEKTSTDSDYELFLNDLPKDECRYAVYDFEYQQDGKRNKILFYFWAPDAAAIKTKMIYSGSTSDLRQRFTGVAEDLHGTDYDEVSCEVVLDRVTRRVR